MFDQLLKTVSMNISTVHAIIKTNERLRKIAFAQETAKIRDSDENTELTTLIKGFPGETEWRVYDHCAVVTRLYAVYEHFVEDLISEWLRIQPDIVPHYSDLEARIKHTHREGVGRLLLDRNKERFQHLSENEIIRGLFYGVTESEKYELIPDAFLFHEQNLRKDVLEKLFTDAGIPNAWKWVEEHRNIKEFIEEIRAKQNPADKELKGLIDYRNDAAHGAIVDQILSAKELLELGNFVQILCKALAELVTCQVILRKTKTGKSREIGQITEWFKQPKAAVAKVKDIRLSVGTRLFLVNVTTSYCQESTIESIQMNNTPTQAIDITREQEVGLKFNTDARKGLLLYVLE